MKRSVPHGSQTPLSAQPLRETIRATRIPETSVRAASPPGLLPLLSRLLNIPLPPPHLSRPVSARLLHLGSFLGASSAAETSSVTI